MNNGKINLILGPMYSGKSSELLRRYRRYIIANKKCLLVKYSKDNRYSTNQIITHDAVSYTAYNCNNLSELDGMVREYDVICIDEIQFFEDSAFYCDKWALDGLIIESCGLNGDFNRQPFATISSLIPLVDNIVYISAIDKKSGNEAPFTVRLINSNEQILIGGKNIYDVMDRQNYNTFMQSRVEIN